MSGLSGRAASGPAGQGRGGRGSWNVVVPGPARRTPHPTALHRISLRLKEDMSNESPSVTPNEAPSSVSGDAWPVLPLGLAAALLRTLGDHTGAYVLGAVIGGIGLLAAVIAVAECVRAVRRGASVGKAVWVVFLLLAGGFAVVHQLVTA